MQARYASLLELILRTERVKSEEIRSLIDKTELAAEKKPPVSELTRGKIPPTIPFHQKLKQFSTGRIVKQS